MANYVCLFGNKTDIDLQYLLSTVINMLCRKNLWAVVELKPHCSRTVAIRAPLYMETALYGSRVVREPCYRRAISAPFYKETFYKEIILTEGF